MVTNLDIWEQYLSFLGSSVMLYTDFVLTINQSLKK